MTPEQIAARLALRVALSKFHGARHELGLATLALRKVVDLGPKTPAFHKQQI
jgi:hypothetical protein